MFGILLLVLSVQFVLEKQGVLLAYLILIPVFLVISVLFCMAMLVFLQKWVASVDGDVVRWSWVFSLVPTRSIERRGIVSIAVRPLPFRWWETRSVRQYPRQERCTVVFVGGEAEASLVLRVEESIAWQLKSLFEQALE